MRYRRASVQRKASSCAAAQTEVSLSPASKDACASAYKASWGALGLASTAMANDFLAVP